MTSYFLDAPATFEKLKQQSQLTWFQTFVWYFLGRWHLSYDVIQMMLVTFLKNNKISINTCTMYSIIFTVPVFFANGSFSSFNVEIHTFFISSEPFTIRMVFPSNSSSSLTVFSHPLLQAQRSVHLNPCDLQIQWWVEHIDFLQLQEIRSINSSGMGFRSIKCSGGRYGKELFQRKWKALV